MLCVERPLEYNISVASLIGTSWGSKAKHQVQKSLTWILTFRLDNSSESLRTEIRGC